MSLFRENAQHAQYNGGWMGTVDLTTSSMMWPAVGLVIVLAAVLGSLLLIRHERTESARGQLIPSEGLLVLAAPVAGTIERMLVEEGDSVAAGQPLFEIAVRQQSPEFQDSELGEALQAALTKQKQLFEEDLIFINASDRARDARLEDEIAFMRQQLGLLDEQLAIKRRQATEADAMLRRIRRIDSGLLTAPQIQQYESAALNAQIELKQLQQQRGKASRELELAERQRGATPIDLNERRTRVERSLADIAQSLARTKVEAARIVRAPRAGVVTLVSQSVGQYAASGARVVTMMPQNSVLQAELWVASRAVGLIEPGQRVTLRYEAFPYRQFGHQTGRIERISGSALTPDEVRAVSGIDVEAPAFRVLVALDRAHVELAGQRFALRPNMAVDADVQLERQPLYRLLIPEPARLATQTQRVAGAAP